MTNLPESVQWVLDFLNINNIPGQPNLYLLPYELRKLKREPRPRKTTNLTINNNCVIEKATGNLNKAVSRNIERFPEDFMFQLTKEEFKNLIFHLGTSSWNFWISQFVISNLKEV